MFRWLERKVQVWAVSEAREDVVRFIQSLRGMDDSEVATLLALATIIRLNAVDSALIPYDVFN